MPTYLVSDAALKVVDDRAPPDREIFVLSRGDRLREASIRVVYDAVVEVFLTNWLG